MTDRAINFVDIVDGIRNGSDAESETTPVLTVEGADPVDVCEELFERFGGGTDAERSACEFYMSPNARREMERGLADRGPAAASLDFLERRIRTDVSMPDETVLFMRPDAVTLGGTVTGSSPVGLGTISSQNERG